MDRTSRPFGDAHPSPFLTGLGTRMAGIRLSHWAGWVGLILPVLAVIAFVARTWSSFGQAMPFTMSLLAAAAVTIAVSVIASWVGAILGWRLVAFQGRELRGNGAPFTPLAFLMILAVLTPPVLTGVSALGLVSLLGVNASAILWMVGIVVVATHAALPVAAMAFTYGWRRLDLTDAHLASVLGMDDRTILRTLIAPRLRPLGLVITVMVTVRALGECWLALWVYTHVFASRETINALYPLPTLGLVGLGVVLVAVSAAIAKGRSWPTQPDVTIRLEPQVYPPTFEPPTEDEPAGEQPDPDEGVLDDQEEGQAEAMDWTDKPDVRVDPGGDTHHVPPSVMSSAPPESDGVGLAPGLVEKPSTGEPVVEDVLAEATRAFHQPLPADPSPDHGQDRQPGRVPDRGPGRATLGERTASPFLRIRRERPDTDRPQGTGR